MTGRSCSQCGATNPAGTEFCGNCHYPVYLDEKKQDAAAGQGVLRVPGDTSSPPPPEPDRPTPPPPPSDRPTRPDNPVAGGVGCAACGTVNEPSRTLCTRCGRPLRSEAQAPPPPPPPPAPASRRTDWRLVGAVAALGLVLIAGLAWFLWPDSDETVEPPPSTTAAPLTTVVRQVEATAITASATNELAPSGGNTYWASNVLDGDRATAWNHSFAERGSGVGEVVTLDFGAEVDLDRLEIVNGYTKSPELFEENSRVRELTIIGDGGEQTVTLDDHGDPQIVEIEVGPTTSLQLRVEAIYEGSRFRDLAISEIAVFEAVPATSSTDSAG